MKHRLLLSFVMTTCTLIAAGCATRTDLKKGLLRAVKGADLRVPFPDAFSPSPTLAPLKARVIGGGDNHSLAIAENGAVLAWGSNASGQLGDGTQTTRLHPGEVHGLGANSNVGAVAGGRFFSLALTLDGTVLAWGTGGDGKSKPQLTPTLVPGLTDVLAWGSNGSGQLGDGTIQASVKFVQVAVPARVRASLSGR